MAKKITEFTEGIEIKDTDIIPFVDIENQKTKKITYDNFNLRTNQNIENKTLYKYDFEQQLSTELKGFQYITLPAYYKKGAGVLQVYFEGCLLDKGTHYEESADGIETVDGDILNTIKIIFDCSGTYNMSIVIQGKYEAPIEEEVMYE